MRTTFTTLSLASMLALAADDVCDGWGDLRYPSFASEADSLATGPARRANLGASVAVLPDFDGDGAVDLAIGVPGDSTAGQRAGAVHIFLSDGGVADAEAAPDMIVYGEAAWDNAGAVIGSAGDVNDDGLTDLLVASRPASRAADQTGTVWLVLGSMTPDPLQSLADAEARIDGAALGDELGASIAGVGDLTGDGFADILIGAPGADLNGANAGAALLFFGPLTGVYGAAQADRVWVGEEAGDRFGHAVAAAGDVDGDEVRDVAIGAPGWGPGLSNDGAVYVTDGDLASGPASGAGLRLRGASAERFGYSLSSAGDVDSDGGDDLWVGARQWSPGKRGAALLLTDLLATGDRAARTSYEARVRGYDNLDYLGSAVAGGADFDGDGALDLLVGAEGADGPGGTGTGGAWVVHGPFAGDITVSPTEGLIAGDADGALTGASLAVIPDLDGDGFDDLMVGSPGGDLPGGVDVGFVGVFHGGRDVQDSSTWYADADDDGWGGATSVVACSAPAGHVEISGDCRDSDDRFHPFAPETSCADPNDYSCDGVVGAVDNDGDGVNACANDCDDGDPLVGASLPERCGNSVDDDCNGAVDDALAIDAVVWRPDSDHDGYGSSAVGIAACEPPAFFLEPPVRIGGDCDDADALIHPGLPERCNTLDDDCDGVVDPIGTGNGLDLYADSDGDGYGDLASRIRACTAPPGYVANFDDCDDDAAAINPDGAESCNLADDDCDGMWYRGWRAEAGWSVGHLSAGDRLGAALTSLADQDGDGDEELVLGAAEQVLVVRGDLRSGSADLAEDLGYGERGWRARLLAPAAGAGFGEVLAAGDLDADGHDDLVVGAPREGGAGVNAGAVHLYFGPFEAERAAPDVTLRGTAGGQGVGSALAVGDLDGDGQPELVIGAPGAARAWVLPGRAVWAGVSLAAEPFWQGTVGSGAGSSVAILGDTNGDGRSDVAIGAPQAGADAAGAVALITAAGDPLVASAVLSGSRPGQRLGLALAGGDLDDDGDADLVVSPSVGRTWVVWSAGGFTTTSLASLPTTELYGPAAQQLGLALGVADLDGDGHADLVLGAPGNDELAPDGGAVYAVYGTATWPGSIDLSTLESAGRLADGTTFPTLSASNAQVPEGFALYGAAPGGALGLAVLPGFQAGLSAHGDLVAAAPNGGTSAVLGLPTGPYGLDLDAGGTWWSDVDGDGWGDEAAPQTGCAMHIPQDLSGTPLGVADPLLARDCDDHDGDIHPGVSDTPGDGLDEDCSGRDGAGSPAVVTACALVPANPRPTDDITAVATASDPDGTTPTILFAWTRNGISQGVTGDTFPASLTGRDDVVGVTCTADDGTGDGSGMSTDVTVFNTAPAMLTVDISAPATAGTDLGCFATGSDADGDPLSFDYAWTIDGAPAGSGPTLSGALLTRGAVVGCSATVSDGFESAGPLGDTVTVTDAPASMTACAVSPATPDTHSTLIASSSATDPDGDTVTVTYTWLLDGAPYGVVPSIVPASTVRGQSWQVRCTPSTAFGAGAALDSDPVVIGNAAPTLSVALSPSTATPATSLTVIPTANDPDNDALSYTYAWTRNGSLTGYTTATIPGGWAAQDDVIGVTVTVSDGTASTSASTSITLTHLPPTAANVSLVPVLPRTGYNLQCAVSGGADPEGQPVTRTITWRRNGAVYTGATSTTALAGDTIPSAVLVLNDVWRCEVTVSDGALSTTSQLEETTHGAEFQVGFYGRPNAGTNVHQTTGYFSSTRFVLPNRVALTGFLAETRATSQLRVGLYANVNDGSGDRPGALVVDSGVYTAAPGGGRQNYTGNLVLEPGSYWLGVQTLSSTLSANVAYWQGPGPFAELAFQNLGTNPASPLPSTGGGMSIYQGTGAYVIATSLYVY